MITRTQVKRVRIVLVDVVRCVCDTCKHKWEARNATVLPNRCPAKACHTMGWNAGEPPKKSIAKMVEEMNAKLCDAVAMSDSDIDILGAMLNRGLLTIPEGYARQDVLDRLKKRLDRQEEVRQGVQTERARQSGEQSSP